MATSSAAEGVEDAGDNPLAQQRAAQPEVEPLGGREVLAVVLWVVLADVAIYRAIGYAGPALFFVAAAIILWLGRSKTRAHAAWPVVMALLVGVSLRLVCCGSLWLLIIAWSLLMALAMTLCGAAPLVLEMVAFIGHVILGGGRRLSAIRVPGKLRAAARSGPTGRGAILFPLAALVVFGTLFVLANPDLLSLVSKRLETAALAAFEWLLGFSPLEILFWCAAAWIALGMLRPARPLTQIGPPHEGAGVPAEAQPAPLFVAIRNMLVMVVVLFAAYLVFEFSTLWFRQFPKGFYYAGYAHLGAMWLTIALALATATLSFALGKSTAGDPRRPTLRAFAWIWSIENLLLAAAVYNRLAIYVGYNGMTQMRVIGIFGVTAVLVGFLLVIYKIARGRSFWWLIRAQLLTVALLVVVHGIVPVDYIVHRHNVARVMRGDLKPAVQIAVKPIDATGMLTLFPLLQHDDELIRNGVRAMLIQKRRELENAVPGGSQPRSSADQAQLTPRHQHWTAYQWARQRLAEKLQRQLPASLAGETSTAEQNRSIRQFVDYAMQWY